MQVSPMFSVIMPSYMGHYQGAATERPEKLRRAIDSVLSQTFMDLELQIVADGCHETCEIVARYYAGSERIHLSAIEKQPLWSGAPRNTGIKRSKGEWIVYLDTDDMLGPEHLDIIRRGLQDTPPPNGWAYFDDWYWNDRKEVFGVRVCNINKHGRHGTCNIVHGRDLNVWWPQDPARSNYAHDRHFINELKAKGEPIKLPTPRYLICHDVKRMPDPITMRSRFETAFEI